MITFPQLLQPTVKLSTGWEHKIDYSSPKESENGVIYLWAKTLHDQASQDPSHYNQLLSQQIQNQSKPFEILGLDEIFRRNTDGFQAIKTFVRALVTIPVQSTKTNIIICHMDAFAYAFLKGAKNFDLLLSCQQIYNKEFLRDYEQWQDNFRQLSNFERSGKVIDQNLSNLYLKLRKIVARPSARDELRTLVTLLISGPSTLEQLTQELGLNSVLAGRMLGVFQQKQIIKSFRTSSTSLDIYSIQKSALPVVIFCLREVMGIELLSSLVFEQE